MANITVELNDRLLDTAAALFKGKTKSELITIALVELVDKYEQKNLYELFYNDDTLISKDYDHKAKRSRRPRSILDSSDAGEDGLDDGGVILDISEDSLNSNVVGFNDSGDGLSDNIVDFQDNGDGLNDNIVDFQDGGDGLNDNIVDFQDGRDGLNANEDIF